MRTFCHLMVSRQDASPATAKQVSYINSLARNKPRLLLEALRQISIQSRTAMPLLYTTTASFIIQELQRNKPGLTMPLSAPDQGLAPVIPPSVCTRSSPDAQTDKWRLP